MNLNIKETKKLKTKRSIIIGIIIKKFIFLFFIFALLFLLAWFIYTKNINDAKKMKEINNSIGILKNDTTEIDKKAELTRTYINTWNQDVTKIQKNKDGIQTELIKEAINSIIQNHFITGLNITFTIPEKVNSINKKSFFLENSEILLKFKCLTEFSVYYFLRELENTGIGFFIVEEFNIKKFRNFNKDIVSKLIVGEMESLLDVEIKLQWYEILGR